MFLCSFFLSSVRFCPLVRKVSLPDYRTAASSDLVVHNLSRFLGLSHSPHPLSLCSWYSYYFYIPSITSHISLLRRYRTGLDIFTSSCLGFSLLVPREKYPSHQ